MAKKRQEKLQPLVKVIVIGLTFLFLGLIAWKKGKDFLLASSYFQIRSIVVEPSNQFLDQNDLTKILGKNIFTIDLQDLERKLSLKYPQMYQVRILRRFPNQIAILTRKRNPLVQIGFRNKYFVVDDKGVVIAMSLSPHPSYPFLEGFKIGNKKLLVGTSIRNHHFDMATKIIKAYYKNSVLANYKVFKIDVVNLSQIDLYLSNTLRVILDGENLDRKMDMLALILSQRQLNLSRVKYIDLRFNEPAIGEK